MRKTLLPALTLFLLSPIVGELVSGSAPPAQWLSPATWLFMVPLYGTGALLARELMIRWRAGWVGILLLGAAYGILEEGVDVMSFFNTAWPDLGAAASYGRWADVSWVWAIHLTAYHAAFSIAIPILLTHLIFPQSRSIHWLGRIGCIVIGWMLGTAVLLGNIAFRSKFAYSPPALPYLGALAAVVVLVLLARRARPPAPVPDLEEKPLPHPILYSLAGFGSTLIFFIAGWVLPQTTIPPILAILIGLALVAGVTALLASSYRHGRQFTDTRKLGLAFGGLTFFSVLSPFVQAQGVNKITGENPSGMVCVGTTALLALLILSVLVRRRESRKSRLSDTFERR
jgi:hypothetical protein